MTQMAQLAEMLTKNNIPFETTYMDKTIFSINGESVPQIWYPNRAEAVCDVICHKYSYGGDKGYLEIMGLVTDPEADSVEGWLTSTDVFLRISAHYQSQLIKKLKKIIKTS